MFPVKATSSEHLSCFPGPIVRCMHVRCQFWQPCKRYKLSFVNTRDSKTDWKIRTRLAGVEKKIRTIAWACLPPFFETRQYCKHWLLLRCRRPLPANLRACLPSPSLSSISSRCVPTASLLWCTFWPIFHTQADWLNPCSYTIVTCACVYTCSPTCSTSCAFTLCKMQDKNHKTKNSLDLRIFLSSRFCFSDAGRRTSTFCQARSSASSWVDLQLELLIRGRLNDSTLARFTLSWPFPSEVPLWSDFASCVPRVVSSFPDASVFVVSAVGVSTWLKPCRSLFSTGLLSASPGNSASSTYVVFRRHHHSLQDHLLSTIVRLRQAPSFALEYASFLATSASDALQAPPTRHSDDSVSTICSSK